MRKLSWGRRKAPHTEGIFKASDAGDLSLTSITIDAGELLRTSITANAGWTTSYMPPEPEAENLAGFPTAALVMEMIRRGFAVMKLPENGEPPEVLKS